VLGSFDIIKVGVIMGLLFVIHWFMRNSSVKELSAKLSTVSFGIIWAIMFFLIVLAQGTGEQFIYFQF
jgi:alginate O-acetyltransferase complex protein AlgI